MLLASSLLSLLVIIPSIYITFDSVKNIDELTLFLYTVYPILDGIILIHVIVTASLFFRCKVNLLWTMILFGIILFVADDTAYLIFSLDEFIMQDTQPTFYLCGHMSCLDLVQLVILNYLKKIDLHPKSYNNQLVFKPKSHILSAMNIGNTIELLDEF
jgi:hypothetical protein